MQTREGIYLQAGRSIAHLKSNEATTPEPLGEDADSNTDETVTEIAQIREPQAETPTEDIQAA